ncbi:hypothetical protein BGZ65_005932 [Modicella reniformis]|uniref:NACHT domain-containing protein n=1 Tax=Modicella reniformis TaxID=1440133 RepID=A0A9P6J8L1_9FUNG|nr:hypothetical protein BGZ65_005932 [Modicella reniformis]
MDAVARKWLQPVRDDPKEQQRLEALAIDLIKGYKIDTVKDAKTVAEVVSLSPVLDKNNFRDLFSEFCEGQLQFHQLDGLAQMIRDADPGYLNVTDLSTTMELVEKCFKYTPQEHFYQLTATVSRLLDAMTDVKVKVKVSESTLRDRLRSRLNIPDPYLVYQAVYACQALLYIFEETPLTPLTPWQAAIQRTGKGKKGRKVNKVVSGLMNKDAPSVVDVSGQASNDVSGENNDVQGENNDVQGENNDVPGLAAVKFGVKDFIHSMRSMHSMEASEVVKPTLAESENDFMSSLKESIHNKYAWYVALRGADILIQNGLFMSFRRLVREASCRFELPFQWGVCQRLGEIASNSIWNDSIRLGAVSFLGEMYRESEWRTQLITKKWILDILEQLALQEKSYLKDLSEDLLKDFKVSSDPTDIAFIQARGEKTFVSYPLKSALPAPGTSSLLETVRIRPDVEVNLKKLKEKRNYQGGAIYISPLDKAGSLMQRVKKFLKDEKKVFLLLGDSGAGKSTFIKVLENDLWETYLQDETIPLYINLSAIDNPEQDMITEQLQKAGFTPSQIRELKLHRKFILICDGYEESLNTLNLYTQNRLNQPGEWIAQMVITCRSEYLGVNYRQRFQPEDHNEKSDSFQEAVITPFSADQIQEYIQKYVTNTPHLPWKEEQYKKALDVIPGLKELVTNPFLMNLSMEVLPQMEALQMEALPQMVNPNQDPLSTMRITRIDLYDNYIKHCLEKGKKQYETKQQDPQTKAAFDNLVKQGFTKKGLDFIKKLAVAIYKEQDGKPLVKYSGEDVSWKADFFGHKAEKKVLRKVCPLLPESGNQYGFNHRSLLEYGLALAVFDPQDQKETATPDPVLARNENTSLVRRPEVKGGVNESRKQHVDSASPLVWRSFLREDSILKFLADRVQQEPVPVFEQRLFAYIEHSKTSKKWQTAAANAITILVKAGVKFLGMDLRGIRIPGANLSDGVFDSAQLQGTDLRTVKLCGTQLRGADLSKARMEGVQFGIQLPTEDSDMKSCAYSPYRISFVVGLSSGDINVYTISNWQRAQTLKGHTKGVSSVVFSPLGDRIASGSSDKTVRLWDATSGDNDKTVRLWDVETGDYRMALSGHTNVVYSVAFSPKGARIASGSSDMTVRLWDVITGECHLSLIGHTNFIYSVAFSPKGDQIATGCGDGTVRLWDIETGTCCHIFEDHSDRVECVVFSPRGDMLASASRVKAVRSKESVSSVIDSPEGDLASVDCEVRLWDVESGKCLAVVQDCRGKFHDIAWGSTFGDKSSIIACIDRSVWVWKPIQEDDKSHDQPHWRLINNELIMKGALIQDVRGLSQADEQYLKQRGAIGVPASSLA